MRLCTREDNVDMILAMRPYSRLQRVIRLLFENVQQVCYIEIENSKISQLLERILMEHIDTKNKLDSKLQICYTCSIRIRSRS